MPGEFDFGDDTGERSSSERSRRAANYQGEYDRETARQQARYDFHNRKNALGCGCLLAVALLMAGIVAACGLLGTTAPDRDRGPVDPEAKPAKAKRP